MIKMNQEEEIKIITEQIFESLRNSGYLGIKMAYQAVTDKIIPDKVDSGSTLITEETIYTKENEKLLFPFREEN